MVEDVPLLAAEVNHEHLHLVDFQRKQRNWTSSGDSLRTQIARLCQW
jgi:aspartate-semialdehyde dehydrogenase